MKRNLLIVLILICGIGYVSGQIPIWNLSPQYVNGIITYPLPQEPTPDTDPSNGYDGQVAQKAQNIMTDASGQILFFIVDSYIYDRNGLLIDQMTSEYGLYTVDGFQGQTAIVPIQGTCDEFYIISSNSYSLNSVDNGRLNYGRFKIRYLANGQVAPCSGFIPFIDTNGDESDMVDFISSIHEDDPLFDLDLLDMHGGNFRFAVTKEQNGVQRLFVANQTVILKFLINSVGISFDGLLSLTTILPSNSGTSSYVSFDGVQKRSEMEVITHNNKFRIAYVIESLNTDVANGLNFKGVLVLDVDPMTGNYVSNSAKIIKYHYTNFITNADVFIKGLEFSQNGEYLYVTHSKTSSTTTPSFLSTLDRFNLTSANPSSTLQVISNDLMYKDSHIERIAGDQLIIPTQTAMKRIMNASSTALPVPTTFFTLMNYNSVSPYTINSSAETSYARLLQVQIDDYDYVGQFTSTMQCCIENTSFDKDTHTAASGTLFWNGGSNPLNNNSGNTVTIKRELRVPAGTSLTITGMNLYFAPGARLVIENATILGQQGGKLTLNGTTLSAATLCGSTSMWLGVEVWGNSTLTQGSLGNSTQGRLQMINGSKIEHAQIGILVSKRQEYYTPGDNCQTFPLVSTTVYDDNRTGGIISLSNAKIENNTTGIFFKPYIAATGIANKSIINRTAFVWDDNYRTDNIKYLVYLMRVKGIQMQADSFSNNISFAAIPSLFNKGVGVFSDNAQFSVLSMCNSSASMPIGVNCANYTRSTFRNLYFGINTANFNNLTYEVNRSNFTNCQSGITSSYTKNEKITENNFYTREIATSAIAPQPYGTGILLNSSRGYKIEENFFTENNAPNAPDETYGVYSISSGITHNEVYNNHFYRLKVGGRSDLINGLSVPPTGPVNFPTTGLQWRCNNFRYPIMKEDILVHKGPIDYRQGYAITTGTANAAANYAARNTFSLYNENQTILNDHDISVIDNNRIKYVYLNSNSQTPDNVSPIVSTTLQTVFPNIVVSPNSTMCPSKLVVVPTKVSIATLLDNKQQLEETVDGGNTQNLKNGILNSSNPYTIVSPYSPYLSDEVISTFLASSASNEQKNIILSANAPLSAAVKEHVISSSLPQTIKDEVIAITGISPMVKLAEEISQAKSAFEEAFNNKLSQLYLDTLTTNQEIVDFLSSFATIEAKKELVYFYITIEDSVNAFELMDELYPTHPDFVNFHTTLNRINNFENLEQALSMDGSVVSSLENLVSNSNDSEIQTIAEYMLSIRGNYKLLPPMYDDESSKMQTQFQEADDKQKVSLLNLYPNPTAGILNFSSSMELTNLQFSIMDMNGRTVYSGEFKDVLTGQVNVAHLNKGLYLVQYKVNDSVTETKKIEIK